METVIGIKLMGEHTLYTHQEIAWCSLVSRRILQSLTETAPVTFAQILYPYADMLSLSGRKGTESTQIFGTHLLLRGIAPGIIEAAFRQADCERLSPILTEFTLYDGCAAADDLNAFLDCPCQLPTVGDFGDMLGGFVPHWRIREAAKVFASFSEISYRLTNGNVVGLAGRRLAFRQELSSEEEIKIRVTCFEKTGVC